MTDSKRFDAATILAGLLAISALATGYAGLSASGYLLPAAGLTLQAILVWLGRARLVVISIVLANLLSETALDLILSFGNGLGRTKLDIAGIALLINFLFGGPLMTILALPMLAAFRWSAPFRLHFARRLNTVTESAP